MSAAPTTRPAAWTRFRHGDFECTVVSDGVLEMGPARENFPDADPAEVDALLHRHYLPTENVRLHQNLLIVDTGTQLVLIDTGVGRSPDLGRGFFGPQTGQAVNSMRAAGFEPADIDVVAITHAHPDHCWGLIDEHDQPLYPDATVVVSDADFTHWTDLSKVDTAPNQHLRDHYIGAHRNLLAYGDRVHRVGDGHEVAPGITAMATPGHSPGHLVYRIESAGETMLCWGDLCHHYVLLLQHPEWRFQFDHDGPAATAQRNRVYDLAERHRHRVFAYHFPFPGLGHLKRDGDGYAWLPTDLELDLPAG
ncbi:MBL fold metallo-hydrolase [Amycolatopsis rhabdoformis]|uniref:MBL fold metallo-hydrolase n=1 Tax=Amycolatopsis rhabdoformis TaxID=1448059 RepID=A0ABZ1HVF3_9PSEU|nr:MBL fold metallo-hydrolase [Amycolatopsis rhabdoformis]WSE26279.1 MBL fold metallo-hydrolase [Amycolatopsis rhabdoformis]